MTYHCYLCGYESKYKPSLRAHMKTHIGKIPQTYLSLDRLSTKAAAGLRSQMMSHFEDEPYEYGVFNFGGDIEKRFQTEKKRYKCRLCDYETFRAGNFKAHVKMHSGKREQDCEECDYSDNCGQSPKRDHSCEDACLLCSLKCKTNTFRKRSMGNDYSPNSFGSNNLGRQVLTLVRRLLKGYSDEKRCDYLCDYSSNRSELGTLKSTKNCERPRGCDRRNTMRKINDCTNKCGYKCNRADDCNLCDYDSASSCGSSEYKDVRPGLKKRTKTRSKKKLSKASSVYSDRTQFKTRTLPPFPFSGFADDVWCSPGGRMNILDDDSLPYAVVLVTSDSRW